jgi:uncharacterized protein YabN with tetrapyrrole methylase and pyrophosphatase domain
VEVARYVGDLFFALVNLAHWKKVITESALRATNLGFTCGCFGEAINP